MPNEKDIGTVISSMEGPSPSEMDFVVNKGQVHRGQFVELDYEEGTLIALVENVVKTNRYFERPESVKEFEKQGTNLFDNFPIGEWEYLVAKTKPLGVFAEGFARKITFPPSPGVKVRSASAENLKNFLHFDDNGMLLGSVEHHGLDVKLNMTKLFQKHLSILAQSGYGKSHTISVLLEELLLRQKEHGRIAVVVFDLHGEYLSFGEVPSPSDKLHKNFSSLTKIVHSRDINIGVPKLSAGSFRSFIPELSAPQKRELNKIISKLQNQMREGLGPYDLADIKSEIIKSEDMSKTTKETMISWMYELDELRLFSNIDSPSMNDLIKPGTLTFVNLSDTINEKKRQLIVSYFARKLFNDRRNKKIPPFVLVLEEAHNFIPQHSSKHENFARPIFRT
ncbi:MAG: DUF87 domain-containing protein, partial [Candidatus Diapherotrites archaeon]|nr:DUF87 domain-containing protein [Candidatus Diapherotrites archaeon]